MQTSVQYATILSKLESIAGKTADGTYRAYYDNIGVATWGFGHALVDAQGQHIRKGEPGADARIAASMAALGFPGGAGTLAAAVNLKMKDMNGFAAKVSPLVRGDTTQAQFDALTDFAYNCGVGNLQASSLLRLHNAKQGLQGISIPDAAANSKAKKPILNIGEAFAAYSNADHQWTLGVFHRRMFEYGMYCGDNYDHAYSTAWAYRG